MKELAVEKRNWLTHARFLLIGLSTFKMVKKFDIELEGIMKTINEIPQQKRNSSFQDELDHTLNNININRDMDQGNYSKILTYLDDLEQRYTEPSLQIDTNLRMVFYFNFTYAHLATRNYKKALKWSNEILNNPDMRNIRLDANCYLRLMLICIHYGLGNYELIRPLVKSAQRYIKKQDREIEILRSFMRFANNNFIEPYNSSKKATFDKQAENLERLSKEEDGKIAMEYFNFLAWLKSMYADQSMQEVEEELLKLKGYKL